MNMTKTQNKPINSIQFINLNDDYIITFKFTKRMDHSRKKFSLSMTSLLIFKSDNISLLDNY